MNQNPLVRTAAAAALLVVPVVSELAFPTLFDGAPGKLVFAASQLIGWLLIGSVVRATPPGGLRLAAFGRRAVLVGIASQIAFAVVYGATVSDGQPLEAAWGLFSLGYLCIAVGGLAWGSTLLRAGRRVAGFGLVATGLLGLLAVLVAADLFHDLFLLSSYAAWPFVGLGLRSHADRRTEAVVVG